MAQSIRRRRHMVSRRVRHQSGHRPERIENLIQFPRRSFSLQRRTRRHFRRFAHRLFHRLFKMIRRRPAQIEFGPAIAIIDARRHLQFPHNLRHFLLNRKKKLNAPIPIGLRPGQTVAQPSDLY